MLNPTSEPVALSEAVRAVLLAVIALLQAFDVWNPTPEQNAAVLGLYIAVSVLLSVFARLRSTPTEKVALTTDQAKALTGS